MAADIWEHAAPAECREATKSVLMLPNAACSLPDDLALRRLPIHLPPCPAPGRLTSPKRLGEFGGKTCRSPSIHRRAGIPPALIRGRTLLDDGVRHDRTITPWLASPTIRHRMGLTARTPPCMVAGGAAQRIASDACLALAQAPADAARSRGRRQA